MAITRQSRCFKAGTLLETIKAAKTTGHLLLFFEVIRISPLTHRFLLSYTVNSLMFARDLFGKIGHHL